MDKTLGPDRAHVTLRTQSELSSESGLSNTDAPGGEKSGVAVDERQERELMLREVFLHHRPLIGWTFYWALCTIGWGFAAQVNGAMISVPSFRRDFGYAYHGGFAIPARWLTAFNVILAPSQVIGGFSCSWLADRYGRRTALVGAIVFSVGGTTGQILSTTRAAFLCSKLVLGCSLGFNYTLGPMATSELCPMVLRGIAAAGLHLGIGIGQLLSNSVIAAFGDRTDRWAYRGPFAMQFVCAAALLIGYIFAPESPVWLVKNGRMEDARRTLLRLYGKDVDVAAKVSSLEAIITEEDAGKDVSSLDCFRGTNRIRTVISMSVFVCQYLVGITFVLGFSAYFFQLAGMAASNSFDIGIGITACGVFGNICSWFFVNSAGRRRVFIGGMAVLSLINALIGIMDVSKTGAAKWVQASMTIVFAFVYFFSVGPMAMAILCETSSSSLRAPTIAFANAARAVMGLAMNFSIPYMVNPDEGNLEGKVGFIFGGLGLLGTTWSYFFIPELKAKTFRDIDMMFFDRVPPRKMSSYRRPI